MAHRTIEEASYGTTYRHRPGTFTVYEIGVYPRGSVLEGQQMRSFLDHFEDGTREENLAAAKAAYPDAELIEGSTFQEPYLGHLPDDDDY